MHQPVESPYLVPFDGTFRVSETPTAPDEAPTKKEAKKHLEKVTDELRDLQEMFYATDRHAVLMVFQAMDAAGKDSTIRAVMTGINPAGCQVYSFKKPSSTELDHDFLWRTAKRLPERGRFGIFNRSYYEEVLVVKVHPEYLDYQQLPKPLPNLDELFARRYESIRDHEKHIARSGTIILKFWLNVSQQEQHNRFRRRIDRADKNWKFNPGDLAESALWDQYMDAYQTALNETSRPWAPWYAIPADSKPFMRTAVADILLRTLRSLDLSYPRVSDEERAALAGYREQLLPGD